MLQLAYSHAMIHVTRSFLLNDFTDLRRRPSVPDPAVTDIVQKCVSAAEDVITLVDSLAAQGIMIESFWFTHYVCFCAIIVIYIYTIQQHQSSTAPSSPQELGEGSHSHYLFTLAEACHRHLAKATLKNSPSRRYSIILEELRREVHKQMGSPLQAASPITIPGDYMIKSPQNPSTSLPNEFGLTNMETPMSLDPNAISNFLSPSNFPASGAMDASLGSMDDIGLLENLEGSVWWAQLDSWVSGYNTICFRSNIEHRFNLSLAGFFKSVPRFFNVYLLKMLQFNINI